MKLELGRLRKAASVIMTSGAPTGPSCNDALRHVRHIAAEDPAAALRQDFVGVVSTAQGDSVRHIRYGDYPRNASVPFAILRRSDAPLDRDVDYALEATEKCGAFTDPVRVTPAGKAVQLSLLEVVELQQEAEDESRRLLALLEGIEIADAEAAGQ